MNSPIKLPPMPTVDIDGKKMGQVWFRAHEVRAYTKQALCDALAVVVEICDEEGREWDSDRQITDKNYASFCAGRIRALIMEIRDE